MAMNGGVRMLLEDADGAPNDAPDANRALSGRPPTVCRFGQAERVAALQAEARSTVRA